jgi:hypothetical protein
VIPKKKKKKDQKKILEEKKKKKNGVNVQGWKVYFWKRNSAYWRKIEKKLIEMSKDDEIPIILQNISQFYHYIFVSYFPSLNPTLRPNKSPYLILRNV